MKLWKKILIVIGIILLIFAIFIGRKVWILKGLQRKVSQYTQISNYYVKITQDDHGQITTINNDGQKVTVTEKQIYETYKKDNQYLAKIEVLSSDGTRKKLMNYCNGETTNTYIETDQVKVATLNSNEIPSSAMIIDYWSEIPVKEFIKTALFSKITSEEYNGKDCYKVSNYPLSSLLYSADDENFEVYWEKETGLMINSGLAEFEYQFNCVTDEDLVEPDISQYTIQE